MNPDLYTFGFDPSTITMTVLGFAIQDAFLDQMSPNSESLLSYFTTIAGLIGMIFIFLMPKKVGVANIIGWCLLMILTVVRPTGGDTLFYTDLGGHPLFDQAVAYGGVITQQEYDELYGTTSENSEVVTYRDAIGERVNNIQIRSEQRRVGNDSATAAAASARFEDIDGVTLHYKLIAGLNALNLAVNTDLVPFGRRAAGGAQNFVEAIKYVRAADPDAAYHTAEFVQACSDTGVVRDTAFKPSTDVHKNNPSAWRKLLDEHITGIDAVNLYYQYAEYMKANDGGDATAPLRPPLIVNCGDGVVSAFASCTNNDVAKFTDEDGTKDIAAALGPIMYDTDLGTGNWAKHDTIEEIQQVVRDLQNAATKVDAERISATNVALIVPMNTKRVVENVQSSEQVRGDVDDGDCMAMGEAAGEGWFSRVGSCLFNDESYLEESELDTYQLLAESSRQVRTMEESGAAATLATSCGDLHAIKSVRHQIGMAAQMKIGEEVQKALEEMRNDPDAAMNFQAAAPNQQAEIALKFKIDAARQQCQREAQTTTMMDYMEICMERVAGDTVDALDLLTESAQGNDWGAVNGIINANMSPEFNSGIREFTAEAGSVIAPIAMWFKGLFGGFSAGTYSEIMPQIITFGVAVALMVAPLLFILGLMLPMYAINAMMIPVLIIGYLMMVRVTFTFIHMFAAIFSTSAASGNISSEQAALQDIAMGNAYAAAFLVTGAIAMMLRSPSSIIQKIAGSADKASTVSFQEVMAAGGALAVAKKVAGGAAAVATGGAAAAAGKVVGGITSGNMIRNQVDGWKAGMLTGAEEQSQYTERSAQHDAMGGLTGGAGGVVRDSRISKGKETGATMRQKVDPEYKANVEAEFLLEDAEKSSRDMLKADDMGKLAKDVKVTKTRDDGSTYEKNVDSMMTEVVEDLASKLQQQLPEGHPAKTDARRAQAMAHGVFRNMYKEGAFSQVSSKRLGGSQGPDQDLVKTFKRVAEKYAARDPNIAKEIKGDN